MENYFYKCSHCNYVHIIPAYWVSYSPEQEIEQPHLNPETGEFCECMNMTLIESEEQK